MVEATNFYDIGSEHCMIASSNGLCLSRPPHAANKCNTARRPPRPSTAPHRNTAARSVAGYQYAAPGAICCW